MFQIATRDVIVETKKEIKGFKAGIFTGVYNGEIVEFPDGEAVGSEVESVDTVRQGLESKPEVYTQSLSWLLDSYHEKIRMLLRN